MESNGGIASFDGVNGRGGANKQTPLWKSIVVASIAAGVQFGWALQLSLLTPYVQQLGVPKEWSTFIWLCGPLSGLIVQPVVGYFSDHTHNKLGRRRPFIIAGAVSVAMAVFLIGFAADLGHLAGDKLDTRVKPRAIGIFVGGFWVLDVANNMLQGPCRALLADLSGGDHRRMRLANQFFSFFMAVGNVVGYALGSLPHLYKFLPFTYTRACDSYCANLKTCFLIDIVLLLVVTAIAVLTVKEEPLPTQEELIAAGVEIRKPHTPFLQEVKMSFQNLGKSMWILYGVTALNWIGWFPFLINNTDWTGRDVFGGEPQGSAQEKNLYDTGVRSGSLGLMLNSVVLAVASLLVEPSAKVFGGVKNWWGFVNTILAICLVMTVPITKAAVAWHRVHGHLVKPSTTIEWAAIGVFIVLGIPLAVNYSTPFALASIYSSSLGAGQGLSLGVLNLSIVIPQMIVSLVSGPLNKQFGGSNLPAFVMGASSALLSAFLAIFVLPNPQEQAAPTFMAGGGHC